MIQPAIIRRATLPSEYKIFLFLGVVARLDKDPAEFDNFLKVIRSYSASRDEGANLSFRRFQDHENDLRLVFEDLCCRHSASN